MVAGYLVMKYLHVIAAAYLVGSIVTELLLRRYARGSEDATVRRAVWHFLATAEDKVAIPFAALLLVSGLLMVYGPFAGGWSMADDLWLAGGLGLFFVLLVLMAGVGGTASKKAHAAYAGGGGTAAAAVHERRYAMVTLVGLALVLLVIWLMVVKPA